MWGDLWGSMVWGGEAGPIQQVPIAPWALVFLGVLLGVSLVRAQSSRVARVLPLAVALLVPVMVVSTPSLIQFQNGTVADAEQVNANFASLRAQILATRTVWVDANGVELGPAVPLYFDDRRLPAVLLNDGKQSGVALVETVDADGVPVTPGVGIASTNRFLIDVEWFSQAGCRGVRVAALPEDFFGFVDLDLTGYVVKYSDGNWYRWSEPRVPVTIRSYSLPDPSSGTASCVDVVTDETVGWTLEPFDFSDAGLTPPFRRRAVWADAGEALPVF